MAIVACSMQAFNIYISGRKITCLSCQKILSSDEIKQGGICYSEPYKTIT